MSALRNLAGYPLSYVAKAFIRHPAPAFTAPAVVNGEFKTVSLSDYKNKYVVLFSYPLDFTFVCPTEITQFSDKAAEFRSANCEVLCWSVDSKFSHLEWATKPRKEGGLAPMNIPMVSDLTHQISMDYGVLLDHTDDAGCTLRGTFIIDGKGILRHVSINDHSVGRNADEILRLVKAFQFADEHGEVCPASWKPGNKTMKADPKGSKEYFEAL